MLPIDKFDEWLNEDLFKNVVENHLKLNGGDYKIASISSEPATNPGDNYLAVLIRSKVVIEMNSMETKTLSYIVKVLVQNDCNEFMISDFNVFPKEEKMYLEILPAFEKLYADVGVEVEFGPKCFYTTDEPIPMIVMEDLLDFSMVDKSKGLDQAHVELALSRLAKFHAASMVHYDTNGPYPSEYTEGMFTAKFEPTYGPYWDSYMDYYIEALRKLPNGEKFTEEVVKWRGVLYSEMCKALQFDEDAFNVLNHGDMWSNNLMFQYIDNQRLRNMKFVDFQLCFWGSIAHDFYYFMISSWKIDFKVKKFDELVEFYFDNLIENLKVLKCRKKLPTLEDLQRELAKRKFIGNALSS